MLPHISPHFIVSVIPGVGVLSILQIRTVGSEKEKQGNTGLADHRVQSSLAARRHEEVRDKPEDTQPGRGGADRRELGSPAVTAHCALLPGLHVADTESGGSLGKAQEGVPRKGTFNRPILWLHKGCPSDISWCRTVSHFSVHQTHLQEVEMEC